MWNMTFDININRKACIAVHLALVLRTFCTLHANCISHEIFVHLYSKCCDDLCSIASAEELLKRILRLIKKMFFITGLHDKNKTSCWIVLST